MRLKITYFLLLLISMSCAEPSDNSDVSEEVPGHDNYTSGWETDNLKGKVKVLKQYKAYVVDFKTGRTDEPFLEFIRTYNSFGNTVHEEYYGSFGELEQSFEGTYSADGTHSKTVWKTMDMNSKTLTVEKFDTSTGRIVSSEFIIDDSIKDGFLYAYDERGNFKELQPLFEDSSKHYFFEYEYDENDRILSEVQFTRNDGQVDTLRAYSIQYDSLGNKTERSNESFVDYIKDSRIMFEYDTKKRLTRLRHFEDGTLTGIIEYDTLGNELVQKEYQEGTFASQTRIIYDYDNKGNWIRQRVFREEKDSEEIELFVKTREIEYLK